VAVDVTIRAEDGGMKVTVDQLIKDLKTLPPNAIVWARIYGSMKPRTIIHGPTERDGAVELILDRDDRKV
jgi:hypothetical protein